MTKSGRRRGERDIDGVVTRRYRPTISTRLAVASLIAFLLLGAGVGAATLPPYVSPSGFWLYSNGLWVGAKEIGEAGYSPRTRERDRLIWAATCRAGRQTVGFTRKVELLGPASSLTLSWQQGYNDLASFELTVNGRRAYFGTRPTSVTLGARERALFRVGLNELEVHATKPPSRSGLKRCNTANYRSTYAFAFSLEGSFSADLALGDGPRNYFQRGRTFSVSIAVRNDGPSRAVDGSFEMNVNKGFPGEVDASFVGLPDWQCTDADTVGLFRWQCTFDVMEPRTVKKVLLRVTINPSDQPFAEVSTSVFYSLRAKTPDPRSNNNDTFGLYLCGTLSRLEDCTKLPT